ncbi:E3 ubiquitin/ISG15 ligase TRIM25 [Labeo rohita]|uniref:E3 ubiquitin/ISG15 ligase TRIM25 n=1 Tax=Labeo rohita TaxID=84645 RepID=UPI0021E2BC3C|nr:E3 ubiquitin/ISG15 ligase TRIM25 [Labeo rohita]
MAEGRISVAEDEFSCSVCLDLLKNPVTIPCGHSYCMNCITLHWNQQDGMAVYSCPLCKRTFTSRPALNMNVVFNKMVEKLRKTRISPSYAGPGDVECDICTGRKHKAVKSCLVCLESYCQTHFDRHEVFRSGKHHRVIDATGRLQEMICSKHGQLLEFYCRTDQRCICHLCSMDEHKNHNTVTAIVARTEKQSKLEELQSDILQRLQEREKLLAEKKEFIQNFKRSAQNLEEDGEKIFTELIHFLEESRSRWTKSIRNYDVAPHYLQTTLKGIESGIDDLKTGYIELQKLSLTKDHIQFLQGCRSFCSPLPYTDGENKIRSEITLDEAGQLLSQLKEQLVEWKNEVEKILDRATPFPEMLYCTASFDPVSRSPSPGF